MGRLRRNRLGEFVNRNGYNNSIREYALSTYNAYVEARVTAADAECKGVLSRNDAIAGWRLVDPRQRISPRWRTEEFREWLALKGDTLTYTRWLKHLQEERDHAGSY